MKMLLSVGLALACLTLTQTSHATEDLPSILVEYGACCGDGGGSVIESFLGRDLPWIVIYSDGHVVAQSDMKSGAQIRQSKLSARDICKIKTQLEISSFKDLADLSEHESHNPDGIFYESARTRQGFEDSDGAGQIYAKVNATWQKRLSIYGPWEPFVSDRVRASFSAVKQAVRHQNNRPYYAEKVALWIESYDGNATHFAGKLHRLNSSSKKLTEALNVTRESNSKAQVVEFEGRDARRLQLQIGRPQERYLLESGSKSWVIVMRPLWPHELVVDSEIVSSAGQKSTWPSLCSE
jgi:hypothetical protein